MNEDRRDVERSGPIAVVVASAGRPEVVASLLDHLLGLLTPASTIVLSVPDASSAPASMPPTVRMVQGVRGAAAQRNAALDHLPAGVEVVFFFDDDALPHPDYFDATMRALEDARIVGTTGNVLADGAGGAEISLERARSILRSPSREADPAGTAPVFSLYGCNFAVRRSALTTTRFDDRLPLYSWLEDLDLSRRLARSGTLVRVSDAYCVHRGAESGGRTAHRRFGYSQIANPLYLCIKGTVPIGKAIPLMLKPAAANLVGAVFGRDRRSRRLRVLGNALALADAVRGRVRPERILTIPGD